MNWMKGQRWESPSLWPPRKDTPRLQDSHVGGTQGLRATLCRLSGLELISHQQWENQEAFSQVHTYLMCTGWMSKTNRATVITACSLASQTNNNRRIASQGPQWGTACSERTAGSPTISVIQGQVRIWAGSPKARRGTMWTCTWARVCVAHGRGEKSGGSSLEVDRRYEHNRPL